MNLFLKILVGVLVFFTPFSFAATEPWAFSIIQGLVVIAWGCVLFSRREIFYPSLFKVTLWVFVILTALALVQCCFPRTLLDTVPFYPITLIRLYTLDHVSLFVTYAAVVLLVAQVYPSKHQVMQLLWILVSAGAAVELCELIWPNGQYIAFLAGVKPVVASVGPFLNRNHGGMFLVMNSLLALGLFFTHQLRYRRAITKEQKGAFVVQQICLGLLTVGLMVAAIFTRSRGAMLSLFMGLFGYAFLCVWAVPSQMRKRLKGFFYTLILLVVCSGWVYTHVEEINEFAHRETSTSAEIRQMMYRASWKLFDKYPVWGIGIGAMPVAINEYTEFDVHQYIERLHNDWLEILLGIGYGGAVLLLIPLCWFVMRVLRRLKHLDTRKQFLFASLLSVLLAMSVGSLVDFHFFIPGCALVFFLVLGMVHAPTFHKGHVHGWHVGWIGSFILMAVLLSTCYIPLQKTRAWRAFVFGDGLKTEARLAAFEQGLQYYPSPHYAMRLGGGYFKAARHAKDPIVQLYYFELAQDTAQTYLEKYPKEKELSRLYLYATRHLQ